MPHPGDGLAMDRRLLRTLARLRDAEGRTPRTHERGTTMAFRHKNLLIGVIDNPIAADCIASTTPECVCNASTGVRCEPAFHRPTPMGPPELNTPLIDGLLSRADIQELEVLQDVLATLQRHVEIFVEKANASEEAPAPLEE
jgi:hypothetical protein